MTFSEWISLASSIGTLFAALLALFTLFELFKQRKSSYKPDLCILQNKFSIKGNRYECGDLLLDWKDEKMEEDSYAYRPSFVLANVGLGTAKKVESKWSFNNKGFIKIINEISDELDKPFFVKNKNSNYSISTNKSAVYEVINVAESFNLEYILPIKNQGDNKKLELPLSYTLLVSAYLSLCIIKEKPLSKINIPNINLLLTYRDIGGNSYRSSHILTCEIILFSQQAQKKGYKNPEFLVRYIEES